MRGFRASWRRAIVFVAAGFLSMTLAQGCTDERATALTVLVSSDVVIPRDLDSLSIQVFRKSDPSFAREYQLAGAQRAATLPASVTLNLFEDEKPSDPVHIVLRGNLGKEQVVLRTATVGFSEEKQKLLRLHFRYDCYRFQEKCVDGQTCIGGQCASDAVDVNTLPDVNGDPTQPSGNGCFDSTDEACAANRNNIDDLSTFATNGCTLDTTSLGGDATKLNVFVRWAASSDRGHVVVLDRDAQTGWVRAADTPNVFTLAPGLCLAVQNGAIDRVEVGFTCATKEVDTSLCSPKGDAPVLAPLVDSACHACAYAPDSCQSELEQAKNDPVTGPLFDCALSCLYDGAYTTADECEGVGTCFFECLLPMTTCKESGTCDQYSAAKGWVTCLENLGSVTTRCASECAAENLALCGQLQPTHKPRL